MLTYQPMKNYYAILGVSPTAKIDTIKSAYRHLMSRYHPDKYAGDPQEALAKAEDINIAFAALSNNAKRHEYDQKQVITAQTATELANEPIAAQRVSDWIIASGLIKELKPLYDNLYQLSPAVAEAFKSEMLQTKRYDQALAIALGHQNRFLATYFGSNPSIHFFALWLFHSHQRAITKELNHLVSVLGNTVSADQIINHVVKHNRLSYRLPDHGKHKAASKQAHAHHWPVDLLWLLVCLSLLTVVTLLKQHPF
jgi:hypothetical protein